MSKKIFIGSIILIIFLISILLGLLMSKQITRIPTNSNDIKQENTETFETPKSIVFTSYLYDKNNPIEYVVTEPQKINEITNYINQIDWTETDTKISECLWKIEITGEDPKTLLMHGEYDNNTAIVSIQNKEKSVTYKISRTNYAELVGFANKKYYLHESKLERPTKEICQRAQKKALDGLSKSEKKEVQEILRETHTMMEKRLVEAVKLVKDPNSLYWKKFTVDDVYQDPYSGVYVKSDGFYVDVENLKKIENIIKEPETKEKIKSIHISLQKAMDKHDIEGCFKAHEAIHDYDYWVINYPPYFNTFPPTDWEGINVYFGNI